MGTANSGLPRCRSLVDGHLPHGRELHRRENATHRGAAYFKKAAFSPIDTLMDALYDERGRLTLVKQFHEQGIPEMYAKD